MSSRYDSRRRDERDKDWDRDRDRGRDRPPYRRDGRSRSRSPPRRGGPDRGRGGDRRAGDRRDDGRDSRRERDHPRGDRRRDDRDMDRDRDRKDPPRDDRRAPRDSERERREPGGRDGGRERELARDKDAAARDNDRGAVHAGKQSARTEYTNGDREVRQLDSEEPTSRQLSELPTEDGEEVEVMDATNEDDTAMMAMMGLTGFGSTKGKHVEGNQGGSADVKKMRTWRQYMNRRGGFNRPLDKIK